MIRGDENRGGRGWKRRSKERRTGEQERRWERREVEGREWDERRRK